jgi:hypothetical protein
MGNRLTYWLGRGSHLPQMVRGTRVGVNDMGVAGG